MRFMHGLRVVGVWGRLNKVRASVSYRLGSNLLANDDVDFVQREFIVIDHFDYYIYCVLPKIGNLTSITTWYTLCLVRVAFLTYRKFNLYTVHYKHCVKKYYNMGHIFKLFEYRTTTTIFKKQKGENLPPTRQRYYNKGV